MSKLADVEVDNDIDDIDSLSMHVSSAPSLSSRLAIRSRTQSSTSHNPSLSVNSKSLTASSTDSKGRLPRFRKLQSDSQKISDTRERSASSDFRSVIDDLTIKNQKLKKKLQRLQQREDQEKSLFELKIHDLSPEKSAELVSLLRGFVDAIPEKKEALHSVQSPGRSDDHGQDSAYASLTPGGSSTDASSHIGRRHKPRIDVVQMRRADAPAAAKQPVSAMSKELIKMKMVVQRLERVFLGRQMMQPTINEQAAESQKASRNVEYLHHLTTNRGEGNSEDESEWIYLNLLNNAAKLHEINVTPSLIRRAVQTMSRTLELSPDGQRVRWRGLSGHEDELEDYFPSAPEELELEPSIQDDVSVRPPKKPKIGPTTFAPARYSTHDKDKLPVSLRYEPVFLPKDSSSSSSNVDSLGASSHSSDEGERDEKGPAPISFFKGRFYVDLTSTDPGDAMVDDEDTVVGQVIGRPLVMNLSSTSTRPNWRRCAPSSESYGDIDDSDDSELDPFIVISDTSPPAETSRVRYDGSYFEATGLTRVEDHFTVTLQVRTLLRSRQQPLNCQQLPSMQSNYVQPRIQKLISSFKELQGSSSGSSEASQPVMTDVTPESGPAKKILDVTYAKLAPTRPPPTFYHHDSVSSDELSSGS